MIDTALALLERLAGFLMAGEALPIAEAFAYPHPVYFGDDVNVVASPEQAAKRIAEYIGKLKANGVAKVEMVGVEVVSEAEDRCCLRVTWGYRAADGRFVASTENEMFFRRVEGGEPKISQINIIVSSNEALRHYFGKARHSFDA